MRVCVLECVYEIVSYLLISNNVHLIYRSIQIKHIKFINFNYLNSIQ